MTNIDGHSTDSGARSTPRAVVALLRPYWTTVLVLALTLTISMGLTYQEYRVSRNHAEDVFRRSMSQASNGIVEKMRTYENALTTVRGFVASSEDVTRAEWDTFFRSSMLEKQFPGAFGFSYIHRTPRAELEGYLEETRVELPGFRVHYPLEADNIDHTGDRYLVQLTAPESNSGTIGLDIASKSINKLVYDDAARKNRVAMSAPFHLHQSGTSRWGVVFAMPLYSRDPTNLSEEERVSVSTGWVACPIGFDHFFEFEWDREWDKYAFSLYSDENQNSGASLFGTGNHPEASDDKCEIAFRRSFTVGGQRLSLLMCPADETQITTNLARTSIVASGSVLFTLMLTGVIFMYTRTGVGARKIALQMTQSLREKDAQKQILIERANAANISKSGFLANMSHEIRTPLSAVLGYTEVLGDQIKDRANQDELYRSLGCIQRSGNHLRSIINDILDLSKIDAGKIDINPTRVCLPDLVREIVDTFRIRAHQKRLELGVDVQTPIPEYIMTDDMRVRQVLINLIGNAIKFTDVGSITIVVRYEDNRLSFAVRDTGIGIHPAVMKTLFHPFEQADNSVTRRHEGTGLGLTISRKIAKLMRGDVNAISEHHKGSMFTFWIPQEIDDQTGFVETIPCSDLTLHVTEPADLNDVRGRVLLVEDGIDNQRLVSHFLRRAGLDVEFASNGKIAIEILENDSAFDVILMDMQMPVMDGYTAAGILRQRGNSIPIIALTAHAMQGDREKCVNAGCTDYLTKPIDRKLIVEMIAQYIRPGTDRSSAA